MWGDKEKKRKRKKSKAENKTEWQTSVMYQLVLHECICFIKVASHDPKSFPRSLRHIVKFGEKKNKERGRLKGKQKHGSLSPLLCLWVE